MEALCLTLKLPADLACCLAVELSRSPAYTRHFARWLTRTHHVQGQNTNIPFVTVDKMSSCNVNHLVTASQEDMEKSQFQMFKNRFSNCEILSVCLNFNLKLKDISGTALPVYVTLRLEEPMNTSTQRDLSWSRRLQPLVTQKVHLENLFSYLCTLGGAYSAMGDYNKDHADQAAVVSLRQLKIASTLGDPVLLSCCCLWYAISVMQKGHFKQAKHIISKQYQFSKTHEAGSHLRLQKMCQGIWNKLRAMKTVTRTNHHPAL
ncbi:uncharacterized protein [Branchiostoma lanceolatum]|uniref:uncharacterized protein n=1 Tax=Branchiostoma lanceolatum TaxID=7740 RepID=UPI003451218F